MRLEGWPQSTDLEPSFETRTKARAPQDEGGDKFTVSTDPFIGIDRLVHWDTSERVSGITSRPYSSMHRIIFSCCRAPALYFMSKRDRPRALTVAAILCATVAGEPT